MNELRIYAYDGHPRIFLPEGVNLDSNLALANHGFLDDVRVCTSPTDEYIVTFITIDRLAQEIERSREQCAPWFAKTAMIVVTHITAWIVDLAVRFAYSQDYFVQLAPMRSQKPIACSAVLEFPRGLSRADEDDAFERHYLQGGVARSIDGSYRPTYFQTAARIIDDVKNDALYGTPLFFEPGLIAVAEVRLDVCRHAVSALGAEGFFSHLKPQTDCTMS